MKNQSNLFALSLAFAFLVMMSNSAVAQVASAEASAAVRQGTDAELAQELANPIASLISIPIQFNYDGDFGSNDDGYKLTTNLQPVIPFELNEEWNLISRTIVPFVYQEDLFFSGSGTQSGLGDTLQSLWFSPQSSTNSGITWGLGPAVLLPTATDDLLGADQWAAGPTLVALTQKGPWTIGVLSNHLWTLAGKDDRSDINNTLIQPFVSYTTATAWSASVTTESTYNWTDKQWAIPLNFNVSKITRLGKLPVSLQAGIGYWAENSDFGAEGLRYRLQVTFLFPR